MTLIERQSCDLCAATDHREYATLGHRHLVRCGSCGYLFADRYDTAELERAYRDDYYANPDDERIAKWVAENAGVWDGLCKTLTRHHPEPSSMLDIGAGTGGFLMEFHERNPQTKLFAIESSQNARESLLQRMSEVEFVADDADGLAETETRFALVTLLQTLEHVPHPLALCKTIAGSLEKGGALLVTVPNNRSYAVTLKGTRDMGCFGNPTHLQFFDKPSLENMLRQAGFARLQRIADFGGSNVRGLPAQLAQYALRKAGRSSELRYLAWK